MKKRARIITGLFIVIIIVALLTVGMQFYHRDKQHNEILLSGTVEAQEIEVGSKVGGRITQVLVKQGDLVKAGTPLVRFDIAKLQAQYQQLEAQVAQAEANLAKLEHGYRPEEITQAEATAGQAKAQLAALRNGSRPQEVADAKAQLQGVQVQLENARNFYQRIEILQKNGYASQQQLDDAATQMKQLRAQAETLQERLKLVQAGPRDEDIKAAEEHYRQTEANFRMLRAGYRSEDIADARAKVAEAKAQLAQLKVDLEEGEVKASVDSRIETFNLRPGDLVIAGAPIAKLLESEQVWVRVFVPETQYDQVYIGQKAHIKIDSNIDPQRVFTGYVEQIADKAEFLPRNIQSRDERSKQVFGIRVHIDNNDQVIKAGMAADVTLLLKEGK